MSKTHISSRKKLVDCSCNPMVAPKQLYSFTALLRRDARGQHRRYSKYRERERERERARRSSMRTSKDAGLYADVYWRVLHMLTYADVCCMLTYADVRRLAPLGVYLAGGHIFSRVWHMLTHADVCCMLTYADVRVVWGRICSSIQ